MIAPGERVFDPQDVDLQDAAVVLQDLPLRDRGPDEMNRDYTKLVLR